MPLTELWLSNGQQEAAARGRTGYASPTSFSAAVAFGVKTAVYSSGGALK